MSSSFAARNSDNELLALGDEWWAGFYMKVAIHDERMMVDAGAACPGLILEDNDDPSLTDLTNHAIRMHSGHRQETKID